MFRPIRQYTHSLGLEMKAEKKKRQQEVFVSAFQYCVQHKVSARKCLASNPMWRNVISAEQLHDRLIGRVKFDPRAPMHVREDLTLLTRNEERELIDWVSIQSQRRSHAEVGLEIMKMLRDRRRRNLIGDDERIPFNSVQYQILCGKRPSRGYFLGLYARHADRMRHQRRRRRPRFLQDLPETYEQKISRLEERATRIFEVDGSVDPRRVVSIDTFPVVDEHVMNTAWGMDGTDYTLSGRERNHRLLELLKSIDSKLSDVPRPLLVLCSHEIDSETAQFCLNRRLELFDSLPVTPAYLKAVDDLAEDILAENRRSQKAISATMTPEDKRTILCDLWR